MTDALRNNAGRKLDGTSPIFNSSTQSMGTFRISDLDRSYSDGVVALTTVAAATTSAAILLGATGVRVQAEFSTNATKCDLLVYRVDPGPVDTLVATFLGASSINDDFYVGGFSSDQGGVDFGGLPVKVRAQNITGGGTVTVTLHSN